MEVTVEYDAKANEPEYKHARTFEFDEPVPPIAQIEAEAHCVNLLWRCQIGEVMPWHVAVKWANNQKLEVHWTNDNEERLITPKFVYNGDDQKIPAVLWQMYELGDMVYIEAAAPGIGHTTFKVTRKDDEGLWGICNEHTVWVPDGDFYK